MRRIGREQQTFSNAAFNRISGEYDVELTVAENRWDNALNIFLGDGIGIADFVGHEGVFVHEFYDIGESIACKLSLCVIGYEFVGGQEFLPDGIEVADII